MKNKISILFFLYSFTLFSQNISEINKQLKLSDSLEFSKELRIYSIEYLTLKGKLFRLYENENSEWEKEKWNYSEKIIEKTVCEYNAKTGLTDTISFNVNKPDKIELEVEKNIDEKWLEILMTNIIELPNLESIKYKLEKKTIIIEGGKPTLIKLINVPPSDGTLYVIQIRDHKEYNSISIDNPEFYFNNDLGIDEYEYLAEFFKIINKMFKIN